jgi:hypothetical protein
MQAAYLFSIAIVLALLVDVGVVEDPQAVIISAQPTMATNSRD